MFGGSIHYQGGEGQYRCEFERTLKGEYCGQRGHVSLDGLLLCETHARQLRLQERVAYCRAILAHIELWSGSAHTRGREDVVDLLGIERAKASAALGDVLAELERSEGHAGSSNGRNGDGKDGDGEGRDGRVVLLWPPLLLLLLPYFLSITVLGY